MSRKEQTPVGRKDWSSYLQQVLAMNPVWQADEILSHRRTTFALPCNAPDNPAHRKADQEHSIGAGDRVTAAQYDQLRNRLVQVQRSFFQMTEQQLDQFFQEVPETKYPEFAATLQRLKATRSQRSVLEQLYEQPDLDKELIKTLGLTLVQPRSQAGYFRERYIQSLRNRSATKRAKKTAIEIRDKHPQLFEMQSDWLTTILNQKRHSGHGFGNPSQGELSLKNGGIILFLVIFAVVKILAILARN